MLEITNDIEIASRPTRGDVTRRKIVDAAISEFKTVGVEKASIAKIARTVGVSRPTFYFHFANKQQLLFELQHRLEEPIVILVEDCEDFPSTLDAVVRGLAKARKTVDNRQLFSDMLLIYTKNTQNIPMTDQPLLKALEKKFIAAKACGHLRDELEPTQAALLYLSSLYGYLIGQGNLADDIECTDAMQVVSSLFCQNPGAN